MKTTNPAIHIPFGYHSNGDANNPHWFLDDPQLDGVFYGSESQAKAKMRAAIAEQIREALTHKENYQCRYIGCADGTLLHVHFRYSWGYDIAGPGRKHTSSCSAQSYDDALASARRHAETYGGISWEC
jgi:hypothetical protein